MSLLYVSHSTKIFSQIPDRIAVVERREARRFPVADDANLYATVSADDETELTVQVLDLSSNGMLLEHDSGYEPDWAVGTRLNVRLRIDSQSAELTGMVRRRAGTNRYGIAFPVWVSREHLRPSHPFLCILGTVEQNWFGRRLDGQAWSVEAKQNSKPSNQTLG